MLGVPARAQDLTRSSPIMNRTEAQYFQFAVAVRSDNTRRVPYFLVQQRPAYRRSSRDFAGRYVRFFAGHDVVLDFLVLGVVVNLDCGAQANSVLGNVVHVNHGKIGEPLSELPHAGLYKLLPLFGHVILGILAEIPEGGGLLNLFRQLVHKLVLERIDLFLQFSTDMLSHSCRIINLGQGEPLRGAPEGESQTFILSP
jgi:hypothetical protein